MAAATDSLYNHEDIKVRRVNFKFTKENNRFYYKDNPFSTHFINVLHILFPTGERFFVNAVLKQKHLVLDEKLKKQVRNFCGQEGIHSAMHERFWEILHDKGYNIKGYEQHVDDLLHKVIAKINDPFTKGQIDLIATTCLEHFTALFAHSLSEKVDAEAQEFPDDLLELFQWHAAEEIEHKHVAYDVQQLAVEHEHAKRVVFMPIVSILLYAYITAGMGMLLYQDRKYLNYSKLPKQFYQFATGLLMELHQEVFKEYFTFYKKDFHPSQFDDYYIPERFFKDKTYA